MGMPSRLEIGTKVNVFTSIKVKILFQRVIFSIQQLKTYA